MNGEQALKHFQAMTPEQLAQPLYVSVETADGFVTREVEEIHQDMPGGVVSLVTIIYGVPENTE